MVKNYIGIDTSVLDRIRKSEPYAKNFQSFVKDRNLIVLIPNGTAIEFFARSDPEESKKAAWWFSDFIKSSNFEVVLGKDWKFLVYKEMTCLFKKPPIFSEKEKQKLFNVLKDPMPRQDLIDDFQNRKKDLFRRDGMLVDMSNKKTLDNDLNEPDQVQRRFENYTGPYENNWILIMINRKFGLKPIDVIIFPHRYKTAYINAILTEYYQLGLMVNKEIKSKSMNPYYEKSGKQKNTHDDHKIVSECSYCKYFLTEDETLYKRCCELFEKNLLALEPLNPIDLH